MSDLDFAIDAIAHRAVADHLRRTDDIAEAWEDYPEIGEHDWVRVVMRVDELASLNDCDDDDFTDAYKFLAERATDDA